MEPRSPEPREKGALATYELKRDFSRTPEPGPSPSEATGNDLVFVIQQHAARRMHWDFRLEVDGVLKSWPLPKGPSVNPSVKRLAVMTEDHPFEYRNFEGVIPKGEYGGGQVILWDEGTYTPDEGGVYSWGDNEEGNRRMREGLEKGKLSFILRGHKLQGSFTLIRTKQGWLFIKHRDEYASTRDVLADDRSVRSGLSIEDLKEGRLPPATQAPTNPNPDAFPDPAKERPMLATLINQAFDKPGWAWEPKLDGVRVLAFIRHGKVELRSRRGLDCTRQYPSVANALSGHPNQPLVLDGEVCALDENGIPRFQLLQSRINLSRNADIARAEAATPVVFYVFDILYANGTDLRSRPLAERKGHLLAKVVPSDTIRLVTHVEEQGKELEASARAIGLEGVVGKRLDSRYEAGIRSRNWVKVKVVNEQEFVIGGYTPGEGARTSTFGAIAAGYYDEKGRLLHAGNVGSGFTDGMLAEAFQQLQQLRTDEKPFANKVEGSVSWVRPELVAQVKFNEWTADSHLRAPVFLGLRTDVDPRAVRREVPLRDGVSIGAAPAMLVGANENGPTSLVASLLESLAAAKANTTLEVEGHKVKLTNLDKVFWPAYGSRPPFTKRDLIRYYVEVAPWLLPHLKDRPLTLTRYPNGIESSLFYQKHYAQPIPPFVETVQIWSSQNEGDGTYILCNNLATLVWLEQLADLEVHAWMSRINPEPDAHGHSVVAAGSEAVIDASVLNYPDFIVFDLDPYIYAGHEKKGAEPEFNRSGWEKTVEVALALKDILDQLRLSSFVKTTGKTGIHVYTPILRRYDYDEVRAATQTIGRYLLQQHPRDITMEWDTSKRTGKVFFDHNQNTRGKTLAAQYSLRPTPWAGASTPVSWSELTAVDPQAFDITSVPARLKERGDPWSDILARKNDLSVLLGA
jgi:bifunctional non-homologous end joining protein LigD